jgi:hypothetical protein
MDDELELICTCDEDDGNGYFHCPYNAPEEK